MAKTTRKPAEDTKSPDQIREEITDAVVAAIKGGTPPWRQPWHNNPNGGWPTNFVSKRRYTGINPLILMGAGYRSKFWGTGWQWSSIGGVKTGNRYNWGASIQKGERAARIVFFRMIPKRNKDTGDVELDDKGREKKIPLLRLSTAFNVEQLCAPAVDVMVKHRKHDDLVAHAKHLRVKGAAAAWPAEQLSQAIHDEITKRLLALTAAEDTKEYNDDPDFEPAERLIKATGAKIVHRGDRACYTWNNDTIRMPSKKKFDSVSAYYETAFHELFHWCERPERVGRHSEHDYAFGELVAELGACFMISELNVPLADKMIQSSQSYLGAWLSKIGGDPKYLFRASTQASKVADYLLGFVGLANAPFGDEEDTEDEGDAERAAA